MRGAALARASGDEFTLMLTHVDDAGEAARIAQELLDRLAGWIVERRMTAPAIIFLGIMIFAVGEMASSPRIQEYITWIAPKEKAGMYTGMIFLSVMIGAALSGMRPIHVHLRNDFLLVAMDQIVNYVAKWQDMFDHQVGTLGEYEIESVGTESTRLHPIAELLRNPQTMRQAIILSEILTPAFRRRQ